MDFKDGILIIDTETTGLTGYPLDRVLEIGIAELKDGRVSPVYSEIIGIRISSNSTRATTTPTGRRAFGSTGTRT